MQSMIQRCWSRLSDVARLGLRGEDYCGNRYGFPESPEPDEQPSPDAVTNAHNDKRKNLDQVDAGVGCLEAMALTESFQIPATGTFRHLVQTVTLPGLAGRRARPEVMFSS
jgi:hypothetical protein